MNSFLVYDSSEHKKEIRVNKNTVSKIKYFKRFNHRLDSGYFHNNYNVFKLIGEYLKCHLNNLMRWSKGSNRETKSYFNLA